MLQGGDHNVSQRLDSSQRLQLFHTLTLIDADRLESHQQRRHLTESMPEPLLTRVPTRAGQGPLPHRRTPPHHSTRTNQLRFASSCSLPPSSFYFLVLYRAFPHCDNTMVSVPMYVPERHAKGVIATCT